MNYQGTTSMARSNKNTLRHKLAEANAKISTMQQSESLSPCTLRNTFKTPTRGKYYKGRGGGNASACKTPKTAAAKSPSKCACTGSKAKDIQLPKKPHCYRPGSKSITLVVSW